MEFEGKLEYKEEKETKKGDAFYRVTIDGTWYSVFGKLADIVRNIPTDSEVFGTFETSGKYNNIKEISAVSGGQTSLEEPNVSRNETIIQIKTKAHELTNLINKL